MRHYINKVWIKLQIIYFCNYEHDDNDDDDGNDDDDDEEQEDGIIIKKISIAKMLLVRTKLK